MRAIAAVVAAAALATGCVGPSRSHKDYELKAANTAEAVAGALGTAQVAVDLAHEGRAFANVLTVTFAEAEDDAAAAQDTFDSVQPPDQPSDDLRDTLDAIVDDATSLLTSLRIESRRGHLKALEAARKDLVHLREQLEEFEDRYGRGP